MADEEGRRPLNPVDSNPLDTTDGDLLAAEAQEVADLLCVDFPDEPPRSSTSSKGNPLPAAREGAPPPPKGSSESALPSPPKHKRKAVAEDHTGYLNVLIQCRLLLQDQLAQQVSIHTRLMACAESDAPATMRWAAPPAATNGANNSCGAHAPHSDARPRSKVKAAPVPRTQNHLSGAEQASRFSDAAKIHAVAAAAHAERLAAYNLKLSRDHNAAQSSQQPNGHGLKPPYTDGPNHGENGMHSAGAHDSVRAQDQRSRTPAAPGYDALAALPIKAWGELSPGLFSNQRLANGTDSCSNSSSSSAATTQGSIGGMTGLTRPEFAAADEQMRRAVQMSSAGMGPEEFPLDIFTGSGFYADGSVASKNEPDPFLFANLAQDSSEGTIPRRSVVRGPKGRGRGRGTSEKANQGGSRGPGLESELENGRPSSMSQGPSAQAQQHTEPPIEPSSVQQKSTTDNGPKGLRGKTPRLFAGTKPQAWSHDDDSKNAKSTKCAEGGSPKSAQSRSPVHSSDSSEAPANSTTSKARKTSFLRDNSSSRLKGPQLTPHQAAFALAVQAGAEAARGGVGLRRSGGQQRDAAMVAQAITEADRYHKKRQKTVTLGKPQLGSISIGNSVAAPTVVKDIHEKVEAKSGCKEEKFIESATDSSGDDVEPLPLLSRAVTAESVPVVAVPRHFRASYCDRVAHMFSSLRGQGPVSELGRKVDLASAIPGFELLPRGVWSTYSPGSGDAVRDLAANAEVSDEGTESEGEASTSNGTSSNRSRAGTKGKLKKIEANGKGGPETNSGQRAHSNKGASSRFLGVAWNTQRGKWEVEVEIDGQLIRSGNFSKEEDAARSYDEHAEAHGKPLNFPDEHASIGDAAWGGRSRYEGLRWSTKLRKWVVVMIVDGVKVSLGASENEQEAARLYDNYARKVPGYHRLNFPDNGSNNGSSAEGAASVRGFIDAGTGVYMERQVGAYCSLHAVNALVGSARLGASPAMLRKVESLLNALDISQAVRNGRQEGFMDQHTVVSLGRNLGLALVCLSLDDPAALDQSSEPQPSLVNRGSSFDGGSGSGNRSLNGIGMKSTSSRRQHADPTHFLRHLVRVGRFILGKPQSRNSDGHFVAVHVRLNPAFASASSAQGNTQQRGRRRRGRPSNRDKGALMTGGHECGSELPLEAYEWLLVDSTRLRPAPFPSLLALLRSLFGTKGWGNRGVLPVLITPLIFSKLTLKEIMTHIFNLGDVMDALPSDWCEPSLETPPLISTHASDSETAANSVESKASASTEESKHSSDGGSRKSVIGKCEQVHFSSSAPGSPDSSSVAAADASTMTATDMKLHTRSRKSLPECPLSSYVLKLPPLERCEVALFLADRLAAPVHGLTVTAAVDLFAGRRRLSQFGVTHQAFLDFCERITDGSSSAVQRCIESSDGPKLLEKLAPFDRAPALVLASIGRLLNDPLLAGLIQRRVTAEINSEEKEECPESRDMITGESAQTAVNEEAGGSLGTKRPRSPPTENLPAWERAATQLRELLMAAQPDFSTVLTDRQQQAVLEDAERVAKDLFENHEPSKSNPRGSAAVSRRTTTKRSAATVSNYFP